MTDFATLVLGANTSGLLKAKTDLAAVTSAGARTEAGIKKSMAGVEGAVKCVPMAAKEAAAGMNSLRLSLDPLYASSKQYEAAQKQVTAAVKLGATSQAEANRIMKLAEAKYLGVGNAAQMAAKQMGGNGGFAHQSRMAAMQLSQVAQQTAATGDFVRALAIQLPDLALGFGAVGIGIGVVAGALLPMAANLVTGRDNAEELENAMDSLSTASYDYTRAADQAKLSVSELALEFGSAAEEAKRAFEFMQGVNLGKALDQLTVALGTMDFSELERFANIIKEGPAELEVLNDTYNKALGGLQEQFGITGEQALKLRDHLNEIRTAKGPEEIVNTVDRLNQYLISAFGSAQDIPPELREMVQRLLEAQTAAARITARLDGSADSANTAANAASNLSGQLSVAAQYAAQLAANLAMAPAGIQGFQNKAAQLTAQISALDAGLGQITASAAGYRKELEQKYGLADAANDAEKTYISGVINRQVKEYTNVQNLNKAYTDKVTALNKVEKAAGGSSGSSGAAKALKQAAKEAEKLADEIERLEFDADPVKKFNAELENLNALAANGLSDGAYAHAVAELNDEFANSNPMISKAGDAIADFVAGGMRDFGDLLSAFKNMLKEMIATAIANPIKLALMGVGGGMAGTAAQAAGAAPGGGGILGSLGGIGGGIGSFIGGLAGGGTGLIGGAANVLGSTLSGGLGSGFASLTHSLAGATSGMAGLGAAIGAIALPVAAVAAVFSFFKKKTEVLDSGLRIMAEGVDLTLLEFEKIKTSRFWGLSKKVGMEFEELSEETAGPLEKVILGIQESVLGAADALGFASSTFDDFSISIDAATRGLSDEEAQAKIAEVLGNFANNFANMIPGLDRFTTEGMNMHEVLLRIVNSLNTTNAAFEQLGFSLFEMSLDGAAAAEAFIGIFGSLDNMVAASSSYYQRFYSDAERVANATDNMRGAMADLGLVMPATIEGFRALVEQAERLGNMDRVGQLINLSGAFAAIVDGQSALEDKAAQDLQAAFALEMEATRAAFQSAIAGLQNELTGARERLAASRAIANALESALRSRVFPSVEAERQSQDRAAEYLRSLVGQAEINDLDALQAALQAVANPSADTYATLEDYRRDFYRTSGVIAELEKTAGSALNADEEAVLLLEKQIADMEAQADRELDMLQQQLDALLGINESVLSLKDAIANLKAAQAAVGGGGGSSSFSTTYYGAAAGSAASIADASNSRAISQLYQEVLGRSADAAGLQFYVEAARKDTSISQIRNYLEQSQEAQTGVLPSFDGGGYTGNGSRSGGLDGKGGFMAMLHPRETVTDHTRSGDSDLVSEMRQMRADMARLVSQGKESATYIKRTSDATEYLANDSKASA